MASEAERLRKRFPTIPPALREGYRAAFTDAQCLAWGERSNARKTLRLALNWLPPARDALSRLSADALPYSMRRLAWLAELTLALETALVDPEAARDHERRETRRSLVAAGRAARKAAIARLSLVAGANPKLRAALVAPKHLDSAAQLADSLNALVKVVDRWWSTRALVPLMEDARVAPGLAAALRAAANDLTRAHAEVGASAFLPGDSIAVNRIEGRVLRELRLLEQTFLKARGDGINVPVLRVGSSHRAVFSARNGSRDRRRAAKTQVETNRSGRAVFPSARITLRDVAETLPLSLEPGSGAPVPATERRDVHLAARNVTGGGTAARSDAQHLDAAGRQAAPDGRVPDDGGRAAESDQRAAARNGSATSQEGRAIKVGASASDTGGRPAGPDGRAVGAGGRAIEMEEYASDARGRASRPDGRAAGMGGRAIHSAGRAAASLGRQGAKGGKGKARGGPVRMGGKTKKGSKRKSTAVRYPEGEAELPVIR